MNIVEAEKFFKEYDGNSFYMYDQDLLKYNQYRSMKISSKQENIWRIQKAKYIVLKLRSLISRGSYTSRWIAC